MEDVPGRAQRCFAAVGCGVKVMYTRISHQAAVLLLVCRSTSCAVVVYCRLIRLSITVPSLLSSSLDLSDYSSPPTVMEPVSYMYVHFTTCKPAACTCLRGTQGIYRRYMYM